VYSSKAKQYTGSEPGISKCKKKFSRYMFDVYFVIFMSKTDIELS